MSSNAVKFFDNINTADLPKGSAGRAQPWTAFHQADESLLKAKSIICDVPTTEETGAKLGRVTGTGSLGGTACSTGA